MALLLIFLSALLLSLTRAVRPFTGPRSLPRSAVLTFSDQTIAAGIRQPGPKHKWGGPCVADIDGDGYYDLVLSFHANARIELYWGAPNGKFIKEETFVHKFWDVHGIHVGPRSARGKEKIMVVSVGGKRGEETRQPSIYAFFGRRFKNVSNLYGFGRGKGRGRTAQFLDLALQSNSDRRKNGAGPDMLVLNYLGEGNGIQGEAGLRQFSYQNVGGNYKLRSVPGLTSVNRGRVEVTDIDGDDIMEVINIRLLRMYRLQGPFRFKDISSQVFPPLNVGDLTVSAVAELDYDNDGNWDLYVARTNRALITNRGPLNGDDHSDILLKNVGGRYVDVTASANIPRGTTSQGVTVGDFNNDGFVDILLVLYKEKDLILLNQGDGTFKRAGGLIPKKSGTVGDHAVAFDYDLDGRLDVMVGHGAREEKPGEYRLMRNLMPRADNHYLHVRIGNEPSLGATSLHAVITVFLGKMKLSRRVGSRGAQGGGGSFLETVHFGLGRVTTVPRVRVRWSNGIEGWKVSVAADQLVAFGRI